jgi:hypothetical protein
MRIARSAALVVLVGSVAFTGLTRAPVDVLADGAAGGLRAPDGAAPQLFDRTAPPIADDTGPPSAGGAPQRPVVHAALSGDVVAAVARLKHTGDGLRRHCTAFLSGPRQITTARHCVTDIAATSIDVQPGYDQLWSTEAPLEPITLIAPHDARDVAHLCLREAATTMPFAAVPRAVAIGEAVTVVHYAAPQVQRQQRQSCGVVARLRTNEFVIDCKLDTGASGAPVLTVGTGGVEVIGVISRAGRGFAIAVPLMASELAVCEGGGEPELSLRAEVR